MFKLLPSYVGSKSYWVQRLERYQDRNFVEIFAGSAVLSINLAKKCVLNDKDTYIHKIISRFDELEVPEKFTKEDYFEKRKEKEWWRHSYCLQALSYSGVFRYSKNGFNVPIKKDTPVYLRRDYEKSLVRWQEISPVVHCDEYHLLNDSISLDDVLVIDPPYENTSASYVKSNFDYHFYWEYIRLNEDICKDIIVFDYVDNLPFPPKETRKSRVNGKREGNMEGIFIFEDSLKSGYEGEKLFASKMKKHLDWLDEPNKPDFRLKKNNEFLELKTDYYDMNKTENFFMEHYSDEYKKTPGGPWQALKYGSKYFCYFFVKNNMCFLFETKPLVERLENIMRQDDVRPTSIPNKTWSTRGYKIKRELLHDLVLSKHEICHI